MNYDEHFLQQQYKQDTRNDASKIWIVFKTTPEEELEVWDFSFEEDKLRKDFENEKGAAEGFIKLEFGWVWENDFNPADLKETYRLLEVTEYYEQYGL